MSFNVPLSSDIILLEFFLLLLHFIARIDSKSFANAIRLRSNIANEAISLFISKISNADLSLYIRTIDQSQSLLANIINHMKAITRMIIENRL
jgi:hypothetical protein